MFNGPVRPIHIFCKTPSQEETSALNKKLAKLFTAIDNLKEFEKDVDTVARKVLTAEQGLFEMMRGEQKCRTEEISRIEKLEALYLASMKKEVVTEIVHTPDVPSWWHLEEGVLKPWVGCDTAPPATPPPAPEHPHLRHVEIPEKKIVVVEEDFGDDRKVVVPERVEKIEARVEHREAHYEKKESSSKQESSTSVVDIEEVADEQGKAPVLGDAVLTGEQTSSVVKQQAVSTTKKVESSSSVVVQQSSSVASTSQDVLNVAAIEAPTKTVAIADVPPSASATPSEQEGPLREPTPPDFTASLVIFAEDATDSEDDLERVIVEPGDPRLPGQQAKIISPEGGKFMNSPFGTEEWYLCEIDCCRDYFHTILHILPP